MAAAREAFVDGPWASLPASGRERLMLALAAAIEEHAEELAQIESLDNGKPVKLALRVDVAGTVAHLRYFAGWPTKIEGSVLPVTAPNMHCYTRREPVGVCAQIIPWNFPLLMAAWKIGPALAAGCTIVLKPAEQTPLSALRLGELALEVGFPPGVLNVLTGDGATGAALVEHPGVDKIAFTGSTEVGREIGAKAGRALKRVTLELGGKSPNVILADADIEAAVKGSFQAIYFNTGQACNAGSRLFVPAERFDEVMGELAERGERDAAGAGPGSRDPARAARFRRAARPRDGLHRLRPRRGRRAARRRRGGAHRQRRLVRRAHPVQLHVRRAADRSRGDLRPGARRLPLRDAGGGRRRANDSEYGLAAGRVDARFEQRPPPGRDAARGLGLHQRLGACRPGGAVRRLQGLRASAASTAATGLDAYLETKTVWTAL